MVLYRVQMTKASIFEIIVILSSLTLIYQCTNYLWVSSTPLPTPAASSRLVKPLPPGTILSQRDIDIRSASLTEKKVILFWTSYHNNKTLWWEPPGGYDVYMDRYCDFSNCEFTDNKTRVNDSKIVLFSNNKMEEDGNTWPTIRNPSQLYVHYMSERPSRAHEFLVGYENKINVTMNYRQAADIPIPFQQLFSIGEQPPYKLRIPLVSKNASIIWPVSNCETDSRREDYVKELKKYIDVDIYGNCGNLTCNKDLGHTCFYEWEKKYKFYLSFENAICDDYITEKFYGPLQFELVPIILSGERYNSELPPNCLIDVKNYPSPRHLANYLKQLSADEEEYSKYFEWKSKYRYGNSRPSSLCKLCKAANDFEDMPAKGDYYNWWFGKCDNDLIERMKDEGGWGRY